jgi:RNA 2',3'-cyclic 3'-phosphodiesterase
MRLFAGLDLPDHQRAELEAVLHALRPIAPLRWSTAANLHITTKFIGEWPEARLEELAAALSGVTTPGPLAIELQGLGWFPNPHQPRIFWVAVKAPAGELERLAESTEAALEPLGIAREQRPYNPHLTLARVDRESKPDLGALRRGVAALPSTDFGRFEAAAFHLYSSESGRYTKLASFPMVKQEDAA